MEFLEGESLADRLTRGRLPLEQALRFGIEMSEALSAAHAAGIVHRDLKPGNIIITRTGREAARLRPCETAPRAPSGLSDVATPSSRSPARAR